MQLWAQRYQLWVRHGHRTQSWVRRSRSACAIHPAMPCLASERGCLLSTAACAASHILLRPQTSPCSPHKPLRAAHTLRIHVRVVRVVRGASGCTSPPLSPTSPSPPPSPPPSPTPPSHRHRRPPSIPVESVIAIRRVNQCSNSLHSISDPNLALNSMVYASAVEHEHQYFHLNLPADI